MNKAGNEGNRFMSSDKSVEKNNMYVNHSDTLKDKILINDLDE